MTPFPPSAGVWRRARRGGALALILAAAMTAAACSSNPKPTIHDAAFVRKANTLCRRELPPLRATKSSSDIFATKPNNRAATAKRVEQVADGLDRVQTLLAAIPVRSADQGEVASWLEEWANYTAVGRQYAAAVRTGRDSTVASVAKLGNGPVTRIGTFARANGIDDCVL
jgi:hypothetical protein